MNPDKNKYFIYIYKTEISFLYSLTDNFSLTNFELKLLLFIIVEEKYLQLISFIFIVK